MLARKALAGTAGAPKVYVEDVFSTYLYTGTGSAQTFTNNLDLSGKGGMVWIKRRDSAVSHYLADTERGTSSYLSSNTNLSVETGITTRISAFNNNGFSISTGTTVNNNGSTFVSWSFRQAEKFFDVVTYSGNSTSGRVISHSLGSTPGCIIVRRLDGDDWYVYHRSTTSISYGLRLNKIDSESSNTATITAVSSTTFTVGTDGMVNTSGSDYVAYLFAHDAGGFGSSGTDNVISCGSYTGNGSATGPVVTLGYEPQWVMVKRTDSTSNWTMFDTMRGMSQTGANLLYANLSDDEGIGTQGWVVPNATGFQLAITSSAVNASGGTYIYIAIRRGPMKKPTSGTSVFKAMYGTGGTPSFTSTFPVDMIMDGIVASAWDGYIGSRLQGGNLMYTNLSNAETSAFSVNMKYDYSYGWGTSAFDSTHFSYLFSRAPGFFDVVCYTGTGSSRTVTHNLGVTPELMLVKNRSEVYDWRVYSAETGGTKYLILNSTAAAVTSSGAWNDTAPTSSVFTVGDSLATNKSGNNIVAYLFASLSGVSKVGSYTGNGSSVTVTTDFQPRFIMVKRTDSTGDWIVSDSTRGLVAGNDPYLRLNSSAAEVTNEDWVDISSTSFTVNQTTNNANVNTGTYIYLAIA